MFDIDVDHIEGCKATSIEVDNISLHIINEECIELGKKHELRLLDALKNDFGFSNNEILIYYTGNRGFHTVVRPKDDDWLKLSSPQRKELVDYIRGIGLNLRILLPLRKLSKIRPEIAVSGGWRRKIINAGLSYEELVQSGEDLLIKRSYAEIDEQVTPDLSRLIRIPNSINGKSGLPSKILGGESELIDFKFDAYLSPFQGKALVKANITLPRLRVFSDEISLVKNQTLLISTPAAVLLALNDAVELLKLL
jgi:DNA primase small subunit